MNNHPPDEVLPVARGSDLGWPYCDPGPGPEPSGRLPGEPRFIADSLTNPGSKHLRCAKLPKLQVSR